MNLSEKFLRGQHIFILPNGMGKNRSDFFRNALIRHGATSIDETRSNYDGVNRVIIVIDENTIKTLANVQKALEKKKFYIEAKKQPGCEIRVVKSLWLSECLKQKGLVAIDEYEITAADKTDREILGDEFIQAAESLKKKLNNDPKPEAEIKNTKIDELDSEDEEEEKRAKNSNFKRFKPEKPESDSSSKHSASNSEDEFDNEFFERELKSKTRNLLHDSTKAWTCAHSSKEQKADNPNMYIIKKLEEMAGIYDKTKETFRALSYQKAILALKRRTQPIQTREELLSIPGIGKSLQDRIWEIVNTGELKKLDFLKSRDDISSLELFTSIHGVGPTIAQNFVAQGFRTLDDLRTKANLTRQQKIGLKHHGEFLQRIPREEAAKIEATVKEAALAINSGLIVQACGSYRRGKASCGDVDVLITHPDGHSHKHIFSKIIEKLHETGFLTDDLVIQDEMSDSQRKYLGVCKLPEENSLHRRLDIIVVPYDEYACALIYFTGSAHFNRSMRNLAKKLGLSLSEKSLNKNVIRKGAEKINPGERIPTSCEQDVFKYLNIPYRTPEERDF